MRLATLLFVLLLSSAALVVLILIPIYGPQNNDDTPIAIDDEDRITGDDVDSNLLTVSIECTYLGTPWHICLMPDSFGYTLYCPAYSDFNETELNQLQWYRTPLGLGINTPLSPCFTCPGPESDCSTVLYETFTENNLPLNLYSPMPIGYNLSVYEAADYMCKVMCEAPKEGEACSLWDPDIGMCEFDKNFCDWDGLNPGTCKACPSDINECYGEGFTTHEYAKKECRGCIPRCFSVDSSHLTIGGEMMASQPFQEATQSSESEASGVLHNCTILAVDYESTCLGAEGKMCVVEFGGDDKTPWIAQVTNQAEESGCIGVIAFLSFDLDYMESFPTQWYTELLIPSVWISEEDGAILLNEKMGDIAHVEVDVYGAACYAHWGFAEYYSFTCNNEMPCNDGNFCISAGYDRDEEQFGSDGNCSPCPRDASGAIHPMSCYFENFYGDDSDTVANVEICVSSCSEEAQLNSENCKFCTSQLTEFKFGIENEEEKCFLCPQDEVQYPDRVVQLLDENVTCAKLDSFFRRLPVSKDSSNCELIQSMNYICGCEGIGYAGANTIAKQNALVWMPCVSAILSILGSLFIIFDILRERIRRKEFYQQIMVCMSFFDVIGSIAYAFTSAPIPTEYYYQGSIGNDATCTAQGFFIQVGTVAACCNVSLAFYYYLLITKGMNESRIRPYRLWFFICPIVLGMAFAFAGLPYYGNLFLWCNNNASYWPDIPIAVAILNATIVMGIVCFDVHKKVQEFKREQERGEEYDGLITKVFWQSFWYLMGFYMTWTPYLALQYFWASDKAYTNYGFILYAGTAVPLQGVWNCFNYARTRQLNHARELLTSLISSLGPSRIQSSMGFIEQETRYTTVAATTNLPEPNRSLLGVLDDNDDELLSYFGNSYMTSGADVDPEHWIANNDSIPILPSFFPLLHSSVFIPNGSARLISEEIMDSLRSRSITAVYCSKGAKADCTTKNNVYFRIRLYRDEGDTGTVIVEIQRRSGFHPKYYQDVAAIFDAADGKEANPVLNESVIAFEGSGDEVQNYSGSSLNRLLTILCPADGETMAGATEFALSVLVELTNVHESGQTAVLISRDLLYSPDFEQLRELIFFHACSSEQDPFSPYQYNHIKLQSLEVLANAMACLVGSTSDNLGSLLNETLRLQLFSYVENALADPRAADLACSILKNLAENGQIDNDDNSRLMNALMSANRYGREAYADLEVHSQEVMSLISIT